MSTPETRLPVAILGAGPVGLAAAAHLVARGIPHLLLEAADSVGHHVATWRHVRMFSPWAYDVDRAARALLEESGWIAPPADAFPTGGDLLSRYLEPLAAHPAIARGLRTGVRVVAVSREGFDKVKTAGRAEAPFLVRIRRSDGLEETIRARAVIDATGTWATPNPLGASGLPAAGELAASARISYGIPDVRGSQRRRFGGRRVAVIGAGHSATNALLDLSSVATEEPETRITWILRGGDPARAFGGGDRDGLPARGELGRRLAELVREERIGMEAGFHVRDVIREIDGVVLVGGRGAEERAIGPFDELIVATGSRPDVSFLRELRTRFDEALESASALAPLIDPNVHSCGTVRPHGEAELRHPEPGFYVIGSKSYGRAPTFLLATGYEQARSVAAALAGDMVAARDVQLELPETGVCSTGTGGAEACCG